MAKRPTHQRSDSVAQSVVPAAAGHDPAGSTPPPGDDPAGRIETERAQDLPTLTREQLEAVRRREPEALGALFERYFDRIYGFVYRLLSDRALAEDVTQEVFLKVHRGAHRIDPARDPGPWLMTIAHNACRDLWRSSAYRMGRRTSALDE